MTQEIRTITIGAGQAHPRRSQKHTRRRVRLNGWTVGAIERRECKKCRKQFHAISLTVPADMTPEEFYLKIKEGVKL